MDALKLIGKNKVIKFSSIELQKDYFLLVSGKSGNVIVF